MSDFSGTFNFTDATAKGVGTQLTYNSGTGELVLLDDDDTPLSYVII